MSLRRRMRTSSPRTALAGVIGVLVLASLAGPLAGRPSSRELRLTAPLSVQARAELAVIAKAAGAQLVAGPNGQVAVRLDGAGPIPQALLDWARQSGIPLPRPANGPTIGSAEAVFSAKDSPTAAAAMTPGPALAGRINVAQRPAWRPVEVLRDEPCLPPLVLAEHLAGRSPPNKVNSSIS